MEVELKFQTDDVGLQRLAAAPVLGDYRLIDEPPTHDLDTYYDTADSALAASGYACRLRLRDGRPIAALKGRGGAHGPIHRRAEWETDLTTLTPDPTAWPPGPTRELAESLTRGEPLQPLVVVEQRRQPRAVLSAGCRIATLSLDRVIVRVGNRTRRWCEVEIEMTRDATQAAVEALRGALQAVADVHPETRSKFEQALALLEPQPPP